MREKVEMLENHSHFLPVLIDITVFVGYISSFKSDFSVIRNFKQIQTAKECTLSRTGRPDYNYLFAFFNFCRNAFQNL